MTRPDVKVRIGFPVGAMGGDFFTLDHPEKGKLDNVTFKLAPEDVREDVTEFAGATDQGPATPLMEIVRGRTRELDQFDAGRATVLLRDDDRRFDPRNTDSPYFPGVRPMRRVWLDAVVEGSELPVFMGFVDDWPASHETQYTNRTLLAFDPMETLKHMDPQPVAEGSFEGDRSGERIRRILDHPGVNWPGLRDIADGRSILAGTDLTGNALDLIRQAAEAEAGMLFCARNGVLTFRDRHAALNPDPKAVLVDGSAEGIRYDDVSEDAGTTLLYNRVVVTPSSGNDQVAEDEDAQDSDLTRVLPRRVDLLFDAAAHAMAGYLLDRFKDFEPRYTAAVFRLDALPAAQQRTLLTLDLGDAVTVVRSPFGDGTPATVEQVSLVDGIRHQVTQSTWTVTLDFSVADDRVWFVLDDPVRGRLDTGRLAFF